VLLSGYVGGEGGIVGDGALGARLSEIQRDKQCYMYFMPNKSRQKEKRVRENTHRYNVVAPSGGRGGGNVEEGGVCVGFCRHEENRSENAVRRVERCKDTC
jgi:hypothetical protein